MPTTIVKYNEDVINFLEDVNYGLTKPQFNHLSTMVEGILSIEGNRSISKIAEHIGQSKDESCIYRFLSDSLWDDKLLNHNRIALIKQHLNNEIKSEYVGFLTIDDTTSIKDTRTKTIEDLDFHYSHSEGKQYWSRCCYIKFNSRTIFYPYGL